MLMKRRKRRRMEWGQDSDQVEGCKREAEERRYRVDDEQRRKEEPEGCLSKKNLSFMGRNKQSSWRRVLSPEREWKQSWMKKEMVERERGRTRGAGKECCHVYCAFYIQNRTFPMAPVFLLHFLYIRSRPPPPPPPWTAARDPHEHL